MINAKKQHFFANPRKPLQTLASRFYMFGKIHFRTYKKLNIHFNSHPCFCHHVLDRSSWSSIDATAAPHPPRGRGVPQL